MKEHSVAQGSVAWLNLRLGIPTASEFDKIVTPTGALSKQSHGYALRLVAEKLLRRPMSDISSLEWVARGKELEPDAVRAYEFQTETKTREVGFVTSDDGMIGASPDRLLIGQPGGLEVKCPSPHVHLGYLLDGFANDYVPQVQGQMMVCELDFVDRWSFHPDMPPRLERTFRDPVYIAKLRAALEQFNTLRMNLLFKAQSKGAFTEKPLAEDSSAYEDRLKHLGEGETANGD